MKNQVCTIEQMKALKELGVDISKASMCYVLDDKDSIDNLTFKINKYSPSIIKEYPDLVFPVFTVTDMLGMMPNEIDNHAMAILNFDDGWFVCYMNNKIHRLGVYNMRKDSLIDAVYSVFFQLAKDGKL